MWVRKPWHPTELQQRRRRAFGYATLADGATWLEDLNTNHDTNVTAGNTQIRLRVEIKLTSGDTTNKALKWRYSHNSGAYTDITAASSVIRTFDSTHFADGDDLVTRLLGGTGNYLIAASAEESTGTFTLSGEWNATTAIESEIALEVISADVADNDTIDIRLYETDNTAFLGGYNQTPRITITKGVGGGLEMEIAYHHLRTMWSS